jgi:DNA-directed RNA polymerase subunit RPC12/RpoP
MSRLRLVITPSGDLESDLRYLAKVRWDLWSRSIIGADDDENGGGARRDPAGNLFFECYADSAQARSTLDTLQYSERVAVEDVPEQGEPCPNCGFVSGPVAPTVCPQCGFREIEPCPWCGEEVSRERYEDYADDLFRCPKCQNRVRLRFNEGLGMQAGSLTQPLVIVERAQPER